MARAAGADIVEAAIIATGSIPNPINNANVPPATVANPPARISKEQFE